MIYRAALLVVSFLPVVAGCKESTAARCVQPSIAIDVDYPGASPAEVEQAVVRPVEQAVAPVSRRIAAIALPGHARVTVVPRGDDDAAARQSIVARLEATREQLPADVEAPMVTLLDPAAPTQLVAVRGGDLATLEKVAEALRGRLLTRPGVQRVVLINPSRRELRVQVDRQRLAAYGLTLDAIATRLRATAGDLPSGSVAVGSRQVVVRTRGASPADLAAIPIADHEGAPVYLRDLAVLEQRLTNDARVRIDGQPAVLLEAVGAKKTVLAEVAGFDAPPRIQLLPLGGLRPPPCDGPVLAEQVPERARLELYAELPDGATLDASEEMLARLEKQLAPALPDGATVLAIAGATPESADGGPGRGALFVLADRPLAPTVGRAAAALAVPPASLSIGGDGRHRALVRLRHPDVERLRAAARDLARTLEKTPGVTAVMPPVRSDLVVELSQRGRELGVTPAALTTALRARTSGIEVGTLRRGADRERLVLTSGRAPGDVAGLVDTPALTAGGAAVTLGQVATLQRVAGPGQIERRDQQRVIYVQVRAGGATDLARLIDQAAAKIRSDTGDLTVERLP